MAQNPDFDAFLDRMRETHDRKNHDYAEAGDPYSNFKYAAKLIAPLVRAGVNPVEVVYLVMIGIKLARLVELKASGKTPNNESLNDTHLDLGVYSAIWAAWAQRLDEPF